MRKIKENVYQRIIAQVDELQEKGLTKIAQNIEQAVNEEDIVFDDGTESYSSSQLHQEVNADLWKAATRFIRYYNLDHADVERVQKALLTVASSLTAEMEWALEVDDKSSSLEPKVPGQKK